MLKMDTHTRQIFLSGVFVYITTITGLIFSYSTLQENHDVRIAYLESGQIQHSREFKQISDEVTYLRTESVEVTTMLSILNKSVHQLTKTTIELGKIAARLDERSKEK